MKRKGDSVGSAQAIVQRAAKGWNAAKSDGTPTRFVAATKRDMPANWPKANRVFALVSTSQLDLLTRKRRFCRLNNTLCGFK
jgi:hypothetical protein